MLDALAARARRAAAPPPPAAAPARAPAARRRRAWPRVARRARPSRSRGGDEPGGGYEVALRPVAGGRRRARAGARERRRRHRRCTCGSAGLPARPEHVYEVQCDAPGWSASAGTFRADAHGRAYVVLTTAARRGEYDAIRDRARAPRASPPTSCERRAAEEEPDDAAPSRPSPRSLALALAGCGGDDERARRRRLERPRAAAELRRRAGGGGEQLALAAPEDGSLVFDKTELEAKAGDGHDQLRQPVHSMPHAVEIEGNGVEEKTDPSPAPRRR